MEDAEEGATHDAPRKMPKIHTVEEWRVCLEEAQLIELGDKLDINVLARALVQISLFLGMSQVVRDTVHVVAILMAQATPANVEGITTGGITDRVVDRLTDIIKAATQAVVAEIKLTSTALTKSSTQIAATATSY